MKHTILENGDLRIDITPCEQIELNAMMKTVDNPNTDEFMYDLLEPLICNSELQWIRPEEIGALTDAPILGIRGQERLAKDGERLIDKQVTAQSFGKTFVEDVEKAWAFMDYQIRSVQQDLAENGYVIFGKAV
jgi:hypothetical protein